MFSRSLQPVAWLCCCSLPVLLIGCGAEFAEPAPQLLSVAAAGEEEDENQHWPISKKNETNLPLDFRSVPTVPASSVIELPLREEKTRYHEVASGETLSVIARKYSASVNRLRKVNLLNRSAVIEPGQMLAIPEPR